MTLHSHVFPSRLNHYSAVAGDFMATFGFLFTACATTLNLTRTAQKAGQSVNPLAPAMAAALTIKGSPIAAPMTSGITNTTRKAARPHNGNDLLIRSSTLYPLVASRHGDSCFLFCGLDMASPMHKLRKIRHAPVRALPDWLSLPFSYPSHRSC